MSLDEMTLNSLTAFANQPVRAFVKLRQLVLAHKDLAGKLDQLERKVGSHDEAIKQLVAAIRQLMAPPDPPKKGNGLSHDPRLGQGAVGASQTDRLDEATETPETHRCLNDSTTAIAVWSAC